VTAEAMAVTLAGSLPVAFALCNILCLLMQHPHVYKRLQDEVDSFYPPGENALDCKHHADMDFLNAVINETLRLHPAVPDGSQRTTQGQGMTIDACYIPPYTSVRVYTWAIHRDPRNFSPFTEEFWPERWLIAEDPSLFPFDDKMPFIHNPNAFIPFSFGPANCVGKNLALKEMKMVLCHLLQQVDLRLAEGSNPGTLNPMKRNSLSQVVVSPRRTRDS